MTVGRVICILRVCMKAFAFIGGDRRWQLRLCIRVGEQSANILTSSYIGWGCWGEHLSADKFQNKAYYTFSELCRTDHHNNHHPGRQQKNREKHHFYCPESRGPGEMGLFTKACFGVSWVGGSVPRDAGWKVSVVTSLHLALVIWKNHVPFSLGSL